MSSHESVDVVVAGGGAAGLAAAAAAEAAGLSCQVLEAQNRLGGRVRTTVLPDGGAVDLGAQMVNGDMRGVLGIARDAGLRLSPVPRAGIDLRIVGDTVLRAEGLTSIDEIHALLEKQVVRWDSAGEVLRALRLKLKWWNTPWESIDEAGRGVRSLVEVAKAPKDSLATALRALLLPPEDEAIAMSHFAEVLARSPCAVNAHAVRDLMSRYASERTDLEFHFPGGMGQVVDRLAANLRRPPLLNTPVQRIRAVEDGVRVTTPSGIWMADSVVVAVPPPAARNIAFDIEGGGDLTRLLSSFAAGDMIKTVLTFETAFWRLDGLSGGVTFADPPGLAAVDGSLGDGLPPRLIAFQGGPLARDWAALSRPARQAMLLRHLRRAFGDDVLSPLEMVEAVWVDDPWSGGGYNATVRAEGCRDAVARLAAWDGPVRFAGAEVDDLFWGYVEGAINSGRKAIGRILGAQGLSTQGLSTQGLGAPGFGAGSSGAGEHEVSASC